MKLPDKFKPHLVASQDQTRYSLCRTAIEGNLSVSTNGRAMVIGIVDNSEDEGDRTWGHVSNEAMKEITKGKTGGPFTGQFAFQGDSVKARTGNERTVSYREPGAANFPNWEHAMPQGYIGADKEQTVTIGICMKWLKPLAEAMGEAEIALTFQRKDGRIQDMPVLVTTKHSDRFGILMPINLSEDSKFMPENNKAFRRATSDIEDRQARRKVEAEAMKARQGPKSLAPSPQDFEQRQKAALEWAERHGIQGTPGDLFQAFEDARTFRQEGGGQ